MAAAPPLPDQQLVDLRERGTIPVRTCGDETRPTLVLLHGWGASSDLNWYGCFDELAENFHVVALNMQGHGDGVRSRQRFTLARCVTDVLTAVDALGVDRFIPVGYSMGGLIAQLLWRTAPERIAGLVLCSTSANFRDTPADHCFYGGVGGIAVASRLVPAPLLERQTDRAVRFRMRDATHPWALSELTRSDPRSLADAGWAIGSFSSQRWVSEIDVPTAVVITDLDTTVPRSRQEFLAAQIPNASVHRLAGNHRTVVEHPEQYIPTLRRACDEIAARI